MSRITRVNIKNYRCIQDLRFKPNRINIFVGRNNTGKSSALEAIILAISSLNNFKDLLGRDIVSEIIERRIRYSIRYFVNLINSKSNVLLEIGNSSRLKLTLEFFDRGSYPGSEVGKLFLSFLEKRASELIYRHPLLFELDSFLEHKRQKKESLEQFLKIFQKQIEDEKNKFIADVINMQKLFFIASLNNRVISEGVYLKPYSGEEKSLPYIFTERFLRMKTRRTKVKVPLLFEMAERIFDINELYDIAVRKNMLSKVLDILRINLESFDDMRKIEKEEIVCTFQNMKEPIPLSFMGDGFITMTKIIFISTLAEKGVVVLEEPENNLHPGYLRIAAEQIVKNNKDAQFFLSTHNIEFIEYLLEQDEKLDEILFIRMYRYSDGDLGYELLSGHDAKYELDELKADLRGT